MKALPIIKRNKLLIFVVLTYIVIVFVSPDKAAASIRNSVYYLIEMLQILPVIFLLTVAIEALVPKETIMRSFGEKSGFKGNLLALLLGSISAGPIYAAFPIGKTLLAKGASVSNVVIILSAWAVIKVPMLANEAKFLGLRFMTVRWVLTVIAVFIMAYVVGVLIKSKDLPNETVSQPAGVAVKEEYCIGCGLCAQLYPAYFMMKDNKAVIKKMPDAKVDTQAMFDVIEQCPAKAII